MAETVKINYEGNIQNEVAKVRAAVKQIDAEGVKVGEQFGAGFTVGADGKLRDSRGKFVKAGQEAGAGFGQGFNQGAGQSGGFTAGSVGDLQTRIKGLNKEIEGLSSVDAIRGKQAEIAGLNKELDGLLVGKQSLGQKFGSSIKGAFAQFGPAALAATGATLAIGALNTGITAMLDKESQLADFSALTGVTGAELQKFGDVATDLSNKFGTTTIENIEAFKGLLSRLGPDIAQSSVAVASMGDSINTLSKASGLNATASMDALTTAMLQYNVNLSDPLEASVSMAQMMNVMAAGAKFGAAEIPQVAEALKNVGNTAASLNVPFEETNALLQSLAAGGKTGAEAGVALRNVLTSLTSTSKEGEDALAAIGLSSSELSKTLTTDGANAAFEKLNAHISKIPDLGEQAALKVKLFGKENLAAASTLLNMVENTDKMTDAVTGTNTAYEQAAITMETTKEQLARLRQEGLNGLVGALEGVAGALGDAFGFMIANANQLTDAWSKVFELDIAGAFDIMAQSSTQYNKTVEQRIALEEQWYEQQKLQLAKDASEWGKKQKRTDLWIATLEKLKTSGITDAKELGNLYDKFSELFLLGKITSSDEFFLAMKNGFKDLKDGVTGAGDAAGEASKDIVPLPGSIGAIGKAISETNKELQAYAQGSDAWEKAGAKVRALEANLRTAKAAQDALTDGLNIGTKDIKTPDVNISAQLVPDTGNLRPDLGKAKTELDVFTAELLTSERAVAAWNTAITASFAGLGSMIAGNGEAAIDAWKGTLKNMLNLAIDVVEKKFLIGKAASIVDAIINPASAAVNIPLLLAGTAALEAARGAINSLDVGGVIKSDQLIMAHQDETIIPFDKAPAFFASAVNQGAGQKSGATREVYRPAWPQKSSAKVQLSTTSFGSGMDSLEFTQSRSAA